MKLLTITFIAGLLWCSVAKAAPLAIVENGQAKAQIVISTNDPHARLAADELQTYVEKMSGAKLEIQTEDAALNQPIRIYVGHTQKAKEERI